MPQIAISASDKATSKKWGGGEIIPALGDTLLGLYFFGEDFPMPSGFDYSNNLNHLRRNGNGGEGDFFQTLDKDNNWEFPMTFDELGVAGVANEVSVLSICRPPLAAVSGATIFTGVNADFSNVNYLHLGFLNANTGSPVAIHKNLAVTTATLSGSDTVLAHRGKREYVGASWQAAREDSYRQWPSPGTQQHWGTPHTAMPIVGGDYPRIGWTYGEGANPYQGALELTALAVFGKSMTAGDHATAFARLSAFITARDPDFWV